VTQSEAFVEVFWTAFKSLSQEQQDRFIHRLLQDEQFAEDIDDILVAYRRRNEPTRPLDDVLNEIQ